LTGRENLKYFGMLRGLKGKELEESIDRVTSLVGLDELSAIDKLYEEYSLGMKARLALARALLHDPPILILDEPTLGLDPPAAREIRSLLVRLARKEGKAVMITTHNMFEAELICDYVAIISSGVIAAKGTVPELKRIVANEVPVSVKFRGRLQEPLTTLESALRRVVGNAEVRVKEVKDGFEARVLAPVGMEEKAISDAISYLTGSGFKVLRAEVVEPSLEDVFIAVTSGQGGEG
jgi:ABC-2 type transport system ATP-binding protein